MSGNAADQARLRRVLDLIPEPDGLRILDLGAGTGVFSTALAERGAMVLAIEGRESNARQIRPHPNLVVEVGDVRGLSLSAHGMFGVSLCLGILYHLDASSAFGLLRSLAEVTERYAVIDTHTGGGTQVELGGETYGGRFYSEPAGDWSSIGNAESFWFAPGDLERLILAAGFAQVRRVPGKAYLGEPDDRLWLVAVKDGYEYPGAV